MANDLLKGHLSPNVHWQFSYCVGNMSHPEIVLQLVNELFMHVF